MKSLLPWSNKKSAITGFFAVFILISVVFVSWFGMNLIMTADHQHQMPGCPLMADSSSICQFNLFNQLKSWQELFLAIVVKTNIILLFFVFSLTFALIIKKFSQAPPLNYCLHWYHLKRKKEFFNYLTSEFSAGILHSKIYA